VPEIRENVVNAILSTEVGLRSVVGLAQISLSDGVVIPLMIEAFAPLSLTKPEASAVLSAVRPGMTAAQQMQTLPPGVVLPMEQIPVIPVFADARDPNARVIGLGKVNLAEIQGNAPVAGELSAQVGTTDSPSADAIKQAILDILAVLRDIYERLRERTGDPPVELGESVFDLSVIFRLF
jgi:hypothetical protein